MPNRDVTIRGTEVGLDINKISIYRGSISSSNLVAVVPKSVFMAGHSFSDDDQQEDYVCQGDDPCRTVLNLSLRGVNQPPTVTITGATSSLTNTNVTLTADANDPEGLAMTYLWSTGETTQTITVTSATAQTSSYTVTVTDDLGETATDSHSIVWSVPTTTQPPATTTTTLAPTPFAQITGVTAAQINDTITLTGEDYNFTGSTWAWTGGAAAGLTTKVINITETSAGTVTYGVTIDGTYTDTHNVTWQAQPTTTTTTTAAPATTTTTTAAPATTTTTTAAPSNCYAVQLLYSPLTTCEGQQGLYYVNFSNFCTASLLYTDSSCTTLASNGYYTTAFGTQEYRFWDGTQFTTSCANC